jgi:hypothetical protein
MRIDRLSDTSLYDLLADAAPDGADAGETATTRRKETVDADAETFEFERGDDHDGLLYDLMATPAPAEGTSGETSLTKKTETLDETEAMYDETGAA